MRTLSTRIVFIIGGARSGKSYFALSEASKIKGLKAYIATAEALDSEMKERIERHKKSRGNRWDTYEEPLKINTVLTGMKNKYSTVVLDCLTVWISNLFIRYKNTEHRTQKIKNNIQGFMDSLKQLKNSSVCALGSGFCSLFIVSNEVGMGIVPDNKMAREFRDVAGFLNQKVAEIADEVYMVTAGIPIKIKNAK